MKAALALSACAVLLAGCNEAEYRAEAQARAITMSTYGQDGRTGLCFNTTYINVGGNYQFSHSQVPCTPEVLAQVRKPAQ